MSEPIRILEIPYLELEILKKIDTGEEKGEILTILMVEMRVKKEIRCHGELVERSSYWSFCGSLDTQFKVILTNNLIS